MPDSFEVRKLIAAAAAGIFDEFRQDPEFALQVIRNPLTLKGWVGVGQGGSQIWMSFPVERAQLSAGEGDAIAHDFIKALREHRVAYQLKK